ncbi:hypothetical protein C0995_013916, partial [Termitomyces sp. Mi166
VARSPLVHHQNGCLYRCQAARLLHLHPCDTVQGQNDGSWCSGSETDETDDDMEEDEVGFLSQQWLQIQMRKIYQFELELLLVLLILLIPLASLALLDHILNPPLDLMLKLP